MRLKNVKGSLEAVENSIFVINNSSEYKNKWNEVFSSPGPIYIEVGCGKGNFLIKNKNKYKDKNFIGLEMYSSVIIRAIEKLEKEEDNSNIKMIMANGDKLEDFFGYGELKGIYLNFSDPWPKKRHWKRRLMSRYFLEIYYNVLEKGSFIEFKTDNDELFDFSLEEIEYLKDKWSIEYLTRDLYNEEELLKGNLSTEYEDKFHSLGKNINKIKIRKI